MKLTNPINIIIADDHEIFRDGLQLMLKKDPGINIMAEASNGEELVRVVIQFKPDVVLTDIIMPSMDGIEATKNIIKHFPEMAIIALSMFDQESLIVDMLEAGAIGYLLKNADKTEILEAIRSVNMYKPYYCKSTSTKLAKLISKSKFKGPDKKIDFSEKEKEIILFICREFTNKEIGDKMFLSKRTVDSYRAKIMEKMEVKSTAGIVIYAIRHGLYKVDENALPSLPKA
jgi:two-component system, NarL family, response regulator NreC